MLVGLVLGIWQFAHFLYAAGALPEGVRPPLLDPARLELLQTAVVMIAVALAVVGGWVLLRGRS